MALRSREMLEGNLRKAGIDEILRQQSLAYELRNKVMNFGHRQKTMLDDVVSVEDQKHGALGDGQYDLPDLNKRPAMEPGEQSKLTSHVPSKVSEKVYLVNVYDQDSGVLLGGVHDVLTPSHRLWRLSAIQTRSM